MITKIQVSSSSSSSWERWKSSFWEWTKWKSFAASKFLKSGTAWHRQRMDFSFVMLHQALTSSCCVCLWVLVVSPDAEMQVAQIGIRWCTQAFHNIWLFLPLETFGLLSEQVTVCLLREPICNTIWIWTDVLLRINSAASVFCHIINKRCDSAPLEAMHVEAIHLP